MGFHDIESELQYYKLCITKQENECLDFVPILVYGETSAIITELSLHLNTPYFGIVQGCNNAGLCSSVSSNRFQFDVTAPQIETPAHLSTYSFLRSNTQFDPSYVSIAWSLIDPDSPMLYFALTLMSHHDGEVPIDNIKLGDVSSTTVTFPSTDWLNDGTFYTAKIVGCNSAYLCNSSETEPFLVDSSPPLRGGFVEPMFWHLSDEGINVHLSWQGFTDPHSTIRYYHLTVSSNYSGYDLSNGKIKVEHDSNNATQTTLIPLHDVERLSGTKIYLGIWAENGVGLMSDVIKTSVVPSYTGFNSGRLKIEKHSCESHYCTNDCTCEVVDGKCASESACLNLTDVPMFNVYDGLYQSPMVLTPSTACLPGYWVPDKITAMRYEWSVSLFGEDPGSGLIDTINDKFWIDVETYDRAIYCFSTGDFAIVNGSKYIYHVRAWHSYNEYSLHRSEGVLVDITPPSIGTGRHVKDTDSDFVSELDFTSRSTGIFAEWSGVFSDAESGIRNYAVAVGTTYGGDILTNKISFYNWYCF